MIIKVNGIQMSLDSHTIVEGDGEDGGWMALTFWDRKHDITIRADAKYSDPDAFWAIDEDGNGVARGDSIADLIDQLQDDDPDRRYEQERDDAIVGHSHDGDDDVWYDIHWDYGYWDKDEHIQDFLQDAELSVYGDDDAEIEVVEK